MDKEAELGRGNDGGGGDANAKNGCAVVENVEKTSPVPSLVFVLPPVAAACIISKEAAVVIISEIVFVPKLASREAEAPEICGNGDVGKRSVCVGGGGVVVVDEAKLPVDVVGGRGDIVVPMPIPGTAIFG